MTPALWASPSIRTWMDVAIDSYTVWKGTDSLAGGSGTTEEAPSPEEVELEASGRR